MSKLRHTVTQRSVTLLLSILTHRINVSLGVCNFYYANSSTGPLAPSAPTSIPSSRPIPTLTNKISPPQRMGTLAGIIDCDEVAAVPRSIGNESYPCCLTRNWDPAMYGRNTSMETGEGPE